MLQSSRPFTPPSHDSSTRARVLLIALALAYAAIGLAMMVFASPKVPYADPWRFLATFLENPFPANVLAADNGHRELFPNLVRFAELKWFDANQWLQIGTAITLALIAIPTLVRSWRRLDRDIRTPATVLVFICVFWLGNDCKLAHGNESVDLFLVLLCLVSGLRCVAGLPREAGSGRAWLASTAGLIATLTFGSGIACFAGFAAVLATQRAPWRHWLPILVGMVSALAVLLLGGGGARATIGIAPFEQLDLLLRWLGAPFVWALSPLLDSAHAARMPFEFLRTPLGAIATPLEHAFGPHLAARWPTAAFGGAGLLWLLVSTWRRWRAPCRQEERFALGLAWFGCSVGVLVVAVRLYYFREHPDQMTSQRYVPWCMMFWAGLMLSYMLREGPSPRRTTWLALGVALLLAPSQVWTGRYAWKQLHTAEITALGAATGVLDSEFDLIETTRKDLLHGVPLLRDAGTSVFAWPETRLLGTQAAAALTPVALREVRVQPVQNLFGPAGCSVAFHADDAPGHRLVLLDAAGTACGLATRVGLESEWYGWLRGTVPAQELRAGAVH
jgi:hypothetical protein